MIQGAAVAAEARTWLGTRFHHQAHLKGVGCDCVGLVLGVGKALGIFPADLTSRPEFAPYVGYSRMPSGGRLEQACARFAVQIPVSEIRPGDVVLFNFNGAPSHAAIVGDYPAGGLSIIHAYAVTRKVVESRFDEGWASRVAAAYRLPGVNA